LEPVMPGVGESVRQALGVDDEQSHGVLGEIQEKSGEEELKAFWERWTGREVKSVRLF